VTVRCGNWWRWQWTLLVVADDYECGGVAE